MKRIYADAGLVLTALTWGSTFPVVKIALNYSSPFTFNAMRFALATILFLPFLRKKEFVAGVKIGIASFLGYAFQTVGLKVTTATNAGFITSTYIVFTPLIASRLYGERITKVEATSVFLALTGVYLLSGYSSFNFGDLLILLCAVAFAFEIAMIGEHSKKLYPMSLAGWQVFTIGVLSSFLAPFTTEKLFFSEELLAALLITGFLATFVAKILQNYMQSHTKSVDAGIILSLEGVFSYLFAAMLLEESLSLFQYFGAALIFITAVVISTERSE